LVQAEPLAFRAAKMTRWPNVRFRAVQASDMAILADIYASARETELARVAWSMEAKRQFLEQQCRLQDEHYRRHYPGADLLLVLLDERPAGRVYVHRTCDDIRLMEITLLPPFRGKGLARSLLAELIEESQRGQIQLSLHVESDNPAREWYERLGFRLVEERGVYWYMVRLPQQASAPESDSSADVALLAS
jgi:ribosomal protein S18 acetylase RimI-like enzyme